MEKKRTPVSKDRVREYWQNNIAKALSVGFCEAVVDAIGDDSSDLKLCWCCGSTGYQEVCHITPHSLGGKSVDSNMVLLCAECHTLSPDMKNPAYIIKWINMYAGSYPKRMFEAMWDIYKDAPEGVVSEDVMLPILLECLEESSSHAAMSSTSTRLAVIEMAFDKMLSKEGYYAIAQ